MHGDELVRTVSSDGRVRVTTLVATDLVREAAERHATGPLATTALGRSLMGALLLATGTKEGETVQLQFRGDGPLRSVTSIAESDVAVRGYVSRPAASGRPEVGSGLGRGQLAVVRFHPSWRSPYTGVVELTTGEIAVELARYLTQSEQRPSAMGLGVWLDPGDAAGVGAAGGFLVEALPGADDDAVAEVERNVVGLELSALVHAGERAGELADRLLPGRGGAEQHRSEPRFVCRCTRDRVRRALRLLGAEELAEIRRAGEVLQVRCEFCGETYRVEARDVLAADA